MAINYDIEYPKLQQKIERLQRENESLEAMLDRFVYEMGLAQNLIDEMLYRSAHKVLKEGLEYAASHRGKNGE